ncbi:WWE domain containing protein [Nitzschia inconspicua]|uniref:WWE domain containing protein n=1 Tax=Nitzschia inconspicua TaxID=303405 RepID=A0A9K3LCY5_9STRA|nr:WWE domain containing protein [Nitzschia inconspicua]
MSSSSGNNNNNSSSSSNNNNNHNNHNTNGGDDPGREKRFLADPSLNGVAASASNSETDEERSNASDTPRRPSTFRQERQMNTITLTDDDDTLSASSTAGPGAFRVAGINASTRTMSSTTNSSYGSSNQHQENNNQEVTVVATPLNVIEERDLARQIYAEDYRELEAERLRVEAERLRIEEEKRKLEEQRRELQEREEQHRRQSSQGGTTTAAAMATVANDDTETIDGNTVITATVVSVDARTVSATLPSAEPIPATATLSGSGASKMSPNNGSKSGPPILSNCTLPVASLSRMNSNASSVTDASHMAPNNEHMQKALSTSLHRKTNSSGSGVFARLSGALRFNKQNSSSDLVARSVSPPQSASSTRLDNNHGHSTKTSNSFDPALNGWTWCWKETEVRMPLHCPAVIVGDPDNCWIRYRCEINRKLEQDYLRWKSGGNSVSPDCELPEPLLGYTVNFETMKQTNSTTAYQRDVNRFFLKPPPQETKPVNNGPPLKSVDTGDELPPPVPRSSGGSKIPDYGAGEGVVWSWNETPSQMGRHDPAVIESHVNHLIRYSAEATRTLEKAYQSRQIGCRPIPGYYVDLTVRGREEVSAASLNGARNKNIILKFVQIKDSTSYERDVYRRAYSE